MKKHSIGLFLSLGVAAFVGVLIAFSLLESSGDDIQRLPAPDFIVATPDGEFRLSQQRGKVVVLYFSFPGCPTCALEAPALGRIQSEFGTQGVEVVAINIAPSFYSLAQWRGFWRNSGATDVLWAQDGDGEAVIANDVTGLGTTIIIDREGRVSYRDAGATSYEKLRSEVQNLL